MDRMRASDVCGARVAEVDRIRARGARVAEVGWVREARDVRLR